MAIVIFKSLAIISFLFSFIQISTSSSPLSDEDALLRFKYSLTNNTALSSWNKIKSLPCSGEKANWVGVHCEKGRVLGLKLDNMGLSGEIDMISLNHLLLLRTLSLVNNSFEGNLPVLKKLGALKSLSLSNNLFSGEIQPDAFYGMNSLKKVYLARNQFTGQIPWSLAVLPKLIELSLEDNGFEGSIPDFRVSKLNHFNVSNNDLQGPIPSSLSNMNASIFQGNVYLCGQPLSSCSSSKNLSQQTLIIVAVVLSTAFIAVVLVTILIVRRINRKSNLEYSGDATGKDLESLANSSGGSSNKKKNINEPKLKFLKDNEKDKFELMDLLGGSAEILGSGLFGASYKTVLVNGKKMVVKRFKEMNNVGKEEFQEHMSRLGKLKNGNLLPIVAYCYMEEEKLLLTQFVPNVCLSVHLHGNRSRSHGPALDWPIRLKIIKGVARGLQCLYNELPGIMAPHGHLKSSNVLLNKSMEPILMDYGLAPVVNPEHAESIMISYKSPEYKQNHRITKKTDVWSFGILILEILTGKFPTSWWQQGKSIDSDLLSWVQSVSPDELTEDVFDKDMGDTKGSEGEIIKLLQIGLACAETKLEKRYDIKETLERIEMIKERDNLDE